MGPLPFSSVGALVEQGGDEVEDAEEVPCAVWPASGRNGTRGRDYDHQGEAPLEFAAALQATNRKLVVDGVTYAIIDAVAHTFVPHVALTLRKVRAGGGG